MKRLRGHYVGALRGFAKVAKEVLDNWEGGDLASAVRRLQRAYDLAVKDLAEYDMPDGEDHQK